MKCKYCNRELELEPTNTMETVGTYTINRCRKCNMVITAGFSNYYNNPRRFEKIGDILKKYDSTRNKT